VLKVPGILRFDFILCGHGPEPRWKNLDRQDPFNQYSFSVEPDWSSDRNHCAVCSISLVTTGCPLTGRGQDHASNFCIADLENCSGYALAWNSVARTSVGMWSCVIPGEKYSLGTRDDNGSHFLTRDPRDPLRFVDPLDP